MASLTLEYDKENRLYIDSITEAYFASRTRLRVTAKGGHGLKISKFVQDPLEGLAIPAGAEKPETCKGNKNKVFGLHLKIRDTDDEQSQPSPLIMSPCKRRKTQQASPHSCKCGSGGEGHDFPYYSRIVEKMLDAVLGAATAITIENFLTRL